MPQVSLIVATCNDQESIKPALTSLLEMDYANLEVIVVNDRSTDQTAQILDSLNSPLLKVITVNELPPDWLGKVHALQIGSQHATGEWLLFADADVHFSKMALQKALSFATEQELDFLTLIPGFRAKSYGLQTTIIQFLQLASISTNIDHIRNPDRLENIGCGAFNLIKRSIFNNIYGFQSLRLEVIDDLGLARRAKTVRARSDVLIGKGCVDLDWYPSITGFVHGLEKNSFAVFQYSTIALLVFLISNVAFLAGILIPIINLQNHFYLGLAGICIAIYMFSLSQLIRKTTHFSTLCALLAPLGQIVICWTALRSAILFQLRGGIFWRNTFYSKNQLIENQYLRPIEFFFKQLVHSTRKR